MINIYANKKLGSDKELATLDDIKLTYSIEKFDTGEIWKDGKIKYGMTFDGTLDVIRPLLTKEKLHYDKIISFEGWVYSIYSQWWNVPNRFSQDTNYDTGIFYNTNNIDIITGSYYNANAPFYGTIFYTEEN